MNTHITAFVLAGGHSSRMGSDKGLMIFNYREMIMHVVDVVQKVFDKVIIITNNPEYRKFGLDILQDISPGMGPAGGILTGLSQSVTPWNFFIACDMPFITQEVITRLTEKTDSDYEAIVPLTQAGSQPLCALYHKNAAQKFSQHVAEGRLKMHDIVSSLNHTSVNVLVNAGEIDPFSNINTPGDWEKLKIKSC
jgi:molybdenum cofactor guanylyltransferase